MKNENFEFFVIRKGKTDARADLYIIDKSNRRWWRHIYEFECEYDAVDVANNIASDGVFDTSDFEPLASSNQKIMERMTKFKYYKPTVFHMEFTPLHVIYFILFIAWIVSVVKLVG